MNNDFKKQLISIIGAKNLLLNDWEKKPFSNGWRYGSGTALAVVKPGNLTELWKVLDLCVKNDLIIIMQAANTGLTGGSTPYGSDYDREIIIINTLRIDKIHLLNNGNEILALAGSTLYDLEKKLLPLGREPHSVIGSTSIGASIVGGVCNNSGGSLVKRGPAYTEMSLYAKIDKNGKLLLINDLDINLGKSPDEILYNLENECFGKKDFLKSKKVSSNETYEKLVRNVNSTKPARFNSDPKLLYGASGSAGKIAVFAVRLKTYPSAKRNQVFYVGANHPDTFWKIRRDVLLNFKSLPVAGDYMHKDCYDAAKKYSKDTFIVLEKLGTKFLPTLFELKRKVDLLSKNISILPSNLSDRIMQFLSLFWPNHLPKRIEKFRKRFDHHWIIEMSDEGIDEARVYFKKFFKNTEGDFFECTKKEGKKAILHRFTAASAFGRYSKIHENKIGGQMSMDIAFPRNEKNWFEKLPPELENSFELKFYYGHLFCHVLHQNYIIKKGLDPKKIKDKMFEIYDRRGAEYPSEHNVGHEYVAKKDLLNFYKKLDPTNSFNSGIGFSSKNKFWK